MGIQEKDGSLGRPDLWCYRIEWKIIQEKYIKVIFVPILCAMLPFCILETLGQPVGR
jgi:hypothetical protein